MGKMSELARQTEQDNIKCTNNEYDKDHLVTDNWVCNWCGSDDVYYEAHINMNQTKWDENKAGNIVVHSDNYSSGCKCGDFESPMKREEWEEKVFEECSGNKDKYIKILDGERDR
jgi:hypothetical protein